MIRRITSLLFLMAFVAQTFSAPFLLADYYINTAAYAKNCINKARPKLHCNGKCQVMKKIQEEEKKEQENAGRFENIKTGVLSTKSFYPVLMTPEAVNIASVKNLTPYIFSISNPSYSFFHPPQV